MQPAIYTQIRSARTQQKKQLAVLIDPDKTTGQRLSETAALAMEAGVDYLFVGGSLLQPEILSNCMKTLKTECKLPVILFPGSPTQINADADALLLLSLISGRNADLLIGRHVEAAATLKASGLELISTGYILIDGGRPTSVSYITHSLPIPADKPDLAAATALAGEMLGLKAIYLEAGSGAMRPVSQEVIRAVRQQVSIPLIVGGGIGDTKRAVLSCEAGADVIVVGSAIEKEPQLIHEMAKAIHGVKQGAGKTQLP